MNVYGALFSFSPQYSYGGASKWQMYLGKHAYGYKYMHTLFIF